MNMSSIAVVLGLLATNPLPLPKSAVLMICAPCPRVRQTDVSISARLIVQTLQAYPLSSVTDHPQSGEPARCLHVEVEPF